MELKLAFIGFGNVARAFVRMLDDRRAELAAQYSLRWRTTAIATGRHGCVIAAGGIDLNRAATCAETGGNLARLDDAISIADPKEVIERCDADLLFETTPLNCADGEPATTNIRSALTRGIHVVTANKGPNRIRLLGVEGAR